MSYKIRNMVCLTALALLLGLPQAEYARAQGIVTLADDAKGNDPTLSEVPDELSLFDDENDKPVAAPAPKKEPEIPVVKEESHASTPSPAPLVSAKSPSGSAPQTSNPLSFSAATIGGVGGFGNNEFTAVDDNVFSAMSNLEKQTAILDLELRKEKVKNEIDALKNQRRLAIEQEEEKQENKKRQKIEWEKTQEAKVVQEQQKLRELDIHFESIRQEKLLNAYKNKMLEMQQKWISGQTELYEQIATLKQENKSMLASTKGYLDSLKDAIQGSVNKAEEMKRSYMREIADYQTQISVLKARIEAQEQELLEKQNPFADQADSSAAHAQLAKDEIAAPEVKLSNLYAVMEIRGQNGELIAKLLNQDGNPFYVKNGTSLQSGHIVDEITSTYVRADKNGVKDYLYFAAGGILPLEPEKSNLSIKDDTVPLIQEEPQAGVSFITSDGVPGMGRDMMAR